MTVNGCRVSFKGHENVLELIMGVVVQRNECTKTTDLYTLKWWIEWCVNYNSIKKNNLRKVHFVLACA